MGLTDALKEKAGDHRASLEALRDALAAGFDEASPNVKPQYAARIQAVLRELADLSDAEAASASDDLAARRKARRDEADAGMRAKRRRAQSTD